MTTKILHTQGATVKVARFSNITPNKEHIVTVYGAAAATTFTVSEGLSGMVQNADGTDTETARSRSVQTGLTAPFNLLVPRSNATFIEVTAVGTLATPVEVNFSEIP